MRLLFLEFIFKFVMFKLLFILLFSIIPVFSFLLFSIVISFFSILLLLFSIIPDFSILLFSIIPDFSILLFSIMPLFDILLILLFSFILLRLLIVLLFLLFSSFVFISFSSSFFSSLSLTFESLSSSSSSLISSLSTFSPRTAKQRPSTSHCVFVIFFNSVFITTGFSSVSSSTNIIIPFLKAIIKCFLLRQSPSIFSVFFPHHDILAISKFLILSKRVISPICFPELAKTKIFSFFFEIKILSSFGEYSIKLVSSSKLLNQVFFPSTVPE